MGICGMPQGTKTGALWEWAGGGREIQEGGDMGVLMADSCSCSTENNKIL